MSHPTTWSPTLAWADLALANDRLAVAVAASGYTLPLPLLELAKRTLASADLSWQSALANYAALAPAADYVEIFSAAAGGFRKLLLQELTSRSLATGDLSWMAAFTALSDLDPANDQFFVKDATTGTIKQLTANEILKRIEPQVAAHTTTAVLTSGDAFKVHTNTGASAWAAWTLWDPAVGERFKVARTEPYDIRLVPATGRAIGNGATNKYLLIKDVYGELELVCRKAGRFDIAGGSATYCWEQ